MAFTFVKVALCLTFACSAQLSEGEDKRAGDSDGAPAASGMAAAAAADAPAPSPSVAVGGVGDAGITEAITRSTRGEERRSLNRNCTTHTTQQHSTAARVSDDTGRRAGASPADSTLRAAPRWSVDGLVVVFLSLAPLSSFSLFPPPLAWRAVAGGRCLTVPRARWVVVPRRIHCVLTAIVSASSYTQRRHSPRAYHASLTGDLSPKPPAHAWRSSAATERDTSTITQAVDKRSGHTPNSKPATTETSAERRRPRDASASPRATQGTVVSDCAAIAASPRANSPLTVHHAVLALARVIACADRACALVCVCRAPCRVRAVRCDRIVAAVDRAFVARTEPPPPPIADAAGRVGRTRQKRPLAESSP